MAKGTEVFILFAPCIGKQFGLVHFFFYPIVKFIYNADKSNN